MYKSQWLIHDHTVCRHCYHLHASRTNISLCFDRFIIPFFNFIWFIRVFVCSTPWKILLCNLTCFLMIHLQHWMHFSYKTTKHKALRINRCRSIRYLIHIKPWNDFPHELPSVVHHKYAALIVSIVTWLFCRVFGNGHRRRRSKKVAWFFMDPWTLISVGFVLYLKTKMNEPNSIILWNNIVSTC